MLPGFNLFTPSVQYLGSAKYQLFDLKHRFFFLFFFFLRFLLLFVQNPPRESPSLLFAGEQSRRVCVACGTEFAALITQMTSTGLWEG